MQLPTPAGSGGGSEACCSSEATEKKPIQAPLIGVTGIIRFLAHLHCSFLAA